MNASFMQRATLPKSDRVLSIRFAQLNGHLGLERSLGLRNATGQRRSNPSEGVPFRIGLIPIAVTNHFSRAFALISIRGEKSGFLTQGRRALIEKCWRQCNKSKSRALGEMTEVERYAQCA